MSLRKVIKKPRSTKRPSNNGFTVFTTEHGSNIDNPVNDRAPLHVSASSNTSIGSVPINRCSVNMDKPKLSGKNDDFASWEIRAKAHFTKLNLDDIITSPNPDPTRNKLFYLELISLVDNESLQLIASNAHNDGKLAYDLLCKYYLGDQNARMVNALHQLSLLKINPGESVQQFICRCDVLRNTLSKFEMTQGTSTMVFLVIQTLNALPASFKIFKTIINTAPELASWESFKMQLMNHISIENTDHNSHNSHVNPIMNVQSYQAPQPQIFKRRSNGHYKNFVNKQIKCNICKAVNAHLTKNCDKYFKDRNQSYQHLPPHRMQSPFFKGQTRGRGGHQNAGIPTRPWNAGVGHTGNGMGYKGKIKQFKNINQRAPFNRNQHA